MDKVNEEQLKLEINHIFESGANEIRVFEMVKNFIDRRYSNNFVERFSSDGVFFKCGNCNFEPKMSSSTDDLLQMNFCPNCGSKFRKRK